MCEPGRALVAQGISLVTQVVLRRGDRLYLNDGIYGSFDEQRFASFDENYPPTRLHPGRQGQRQALTGDKRPFRVLAPPAIPPMCCRGRRCCPTASPMAISSCSSAMGAYTVSSRSPFNGYYPDSWAIVED